MCARYAATPFVTCDSVGLPATSENTPGANPAAVAVAVNSLEEGQPRNAAVGEEQGTHLTAREQHVGEPCPCAAGPKMIFVGKLN